MYLSLYCKGWKRVTQGLRVRGSWRTNINCNILTPIFLASTLCLSRSPDAQPEALGSTLLGVGFLYCILSATSLVPKLHRGSRGPLRSDVASPTTFRLQLPLSNWNWNSKSTVLFSVLTELYNSSRPFDLWNHMFNRHQAEITVMQFRSHSLPVRQSMRVS